MHLDDLEDDPKADMKALLPQIISFLHKSLLPLYVSSGSSSSNAGVASAGAGAAEDESPNKKRRKGQRASLGGGAAAAPGPAFGAGPGAAGAGAAAADHPAAASSAAAVTPTPKVLLHCHQGCSRSASCAIAYVMVVSQAKWQPAQMVVTLKRFLAAPNEGFQKQVTDFCNSRAAQQLRGELQHVEEARLKIAEYAVDLVGNFDSRRPSLPATVQDFWRTSVMGLLILANKQVCTAVANLTM